MKNSYTPYVKKDPFVKFERNESIKAAQLRVIDANGENIGVLTKADALAKAKEQELDLIVVSPVGDTPVAKILDWSKFKYLQSKKSKNKGKSVVIKEWQFKPNIEEYHMGFKLKKMEEYLKKGGKAKATVKAVKRAPPQQVFETMEKVLKLVEPFAEKASEVNREGRNISIFLKHK